MLEYLCQCMDQLFEDGSHGDVPLSPKRRPGSMNSNSLSTSTLPPQSSLLLHNPHEDRPPRVGQQDSIVAEILPVVPNNSRPVKERTSFRGPPAEKKILRTNTVQKFWNK
eukprot:6315667-Amphidinium_carterae.1